MPGTVLPPRGFAAADPALADGDEVEPGAEAAPGACEHDATNVGIPVAFDHLRGQLVQHVAADRIESLGTIQGDDNDAIALLDKQLFRC